MNSVRARRPPLILRLANGMVVCLVALVALGAPVSASFAKDSLDPAHTAKHKASSSISGQQIRVAMFPSAESVNAISHGHSGVGWLLYYAPSRGLTHPNLVVKLITLPGSKVATADVYQTPHGKASIPMAFHAGRVSFRNQMSPAMVMTADDRRWIINGLPNFNLTLDIYSPFHAMWEPVPLSQLLNHTVSTSKHSLIYQIITRAGPNGLPKWDLRELIPSLNGDAVLRTNYMFKEGGEPVLVLPSLSPSWPYVAFDGGFTQGFGTLQPPITVDWTSGRLKDFSEVVSMRAESEGYGFYSILPIPLHKVTEPDFEAPWGFYNLSGTAQSMPNLIIRTQHNTAFDPYYSDYGNDTLTAPLFPKQSENVRYSWADHPGNELFSYKVDVFGFVPYVTREPIAGGLATIVAPQWSSYPGWVVDHSWPITTFVATNGHSYPTSEGIYDWASDSFGSPFLRGWTAKYDTKYFKSITSGFRGEYRIGRPQPPVLYVSSVDDRLHLLGAQYGLWDLSPGWSMEERNLDNGLYIDQWRLFHQTQRKKTLVAWVARLGHSLLYSGPKGAYIGTETEPASYSTTLPPHSVATWRQFTKLVKQFKAQDPMHLSTWIPHARQGIVHDVSLADVAANAKGFRMVMTVGGGGRIRLGPLGDLRPGVFVVRHAYGTHAWSVTPAKPASLSVTLRFSESNVMVGIPVWIAVDLSNLGDLPLNSKLTLLAGGSKAMSFRVGLAGLEKQRLTLPWTPTQGGAVTISATTDSFHKVLAHLVVLPYSRGALSTLTAISLPGTPPILFYVLGGILVIIAVAMVGFWKGIVSSAK